MQDGEGLKFQVRCVSQYAPVPEYQHPAIDIHIFFTGILEMLGIFYFKNRRIHTDKVFSSVMGVVLLPEVGALL
jgi:hypothetical protein